jgi:electron transfer flavoprotein alpha subunit
MASAAEAIVEDQSEATDLIVMATVNPLAVFMDEAKYSDFYQKLKEETDKSGANLSPSTERGRNAIRKLAFRVTKAKTTLDKAGLG